ncbi:tRNA pseudouridine(38-40) synthase TruA [Halobacteriales archaeon QS_3_64_16]|nr:MAG: tRNA pseudouridine(38-40) synthase TruA [Halobacteriales archaeon QS_3_64_16]
MRAFRIAYDGQGYWGFQRQPDVETVEDELFDALRALGILEESARKPAGYAAAGRTDRGVSALAQTIGLRCPGWCTPRALNAELPGAIRAWASADVPSDFHATHDATSREYTYHLHAPEVDGDRLRAALDALSGTHDCHNLTPDERNTTRTLETDLESDTEAPFFVLRVRAEGFSKQLVRQLVALVRSVATGEVPFTRVERALSAERLDGGAGVGPAPASPLVLTEVRYPGVEFAVDREAAASAREVFERRRIEHATRARVASTVADNVR